MTMFIDLLDAVRAFDDSVKFLLPTPKERKTTPSKFTAEVAILTSTADEFDSITSFIKELKKIGTEADDSCTYYSGVLTCGGVETAIVLPYPHDMGVPSTVSLTTKILSAFHPKYAFMVGIAAGNKNVNNIGDILIAENTINYEKVVAIERKDGTKRSKFMQSSEGINKSLKTKLNQFARSDSIERIRVEYPEKDKIPHDLACQMGLMVTGSSIVRSQSKVDELVQDYHNVVGLDMETSGFYYAAAHTFSSAPQFVSIKGVSDFGDNQDHKLSAADRKKYALYTSSRALVEFVEHHL